MTRVGRAYAAVAALALVCLLADDALADAPLEEVVVTARRRAEAAAAVPRVVDVVRAPELGTGSVDGLQSLATHVPGLSFESLWGGSGSAPVIRGQAQPSTAGDNVAVFVDGVYQANRAGIDVEMLDFERIEIVRGPQSALFGRSAFAGAIHHVSRAPTASLAYGVRADLGSDRLAGAHAWVSGPLGDDTWRGRFAVGSRAMDGTHRDALDRRALGGLQAESAALSIERAAGPGSTWTAVLRARWSQRSSSHPATAMLDGSVYDCGARDSVSGLWSYYCGRIGARAPVTISPDLPDSRGRSGQVSLEVSAPLADHVLESRSSFYSARTTAFRDFDGSRDAFVLGVCRTGGSCTPGPGAPRVVDRLVAIDVVQRQRSAVDEWAQDLRLRSNDTGRMQWSIGAHITCARERPSTTLGADGGGLLAGEQLTALLPASPSRLGPISLLTRALVPDPAREQRPQSATVVDRRTYALYGTVDWQVSQAATLRLELRASEESERLDNVTANFAAGSGRALPRVRHGDVTPRIELAVAPAEAWYAWTSAAKGSRSGGVNAIPGLDASERGFDPEANWTYELGMRWRSVAHRAAVTGTLYYIDWWNTQIPGFATTPGIGNLITRNTAGIATRGFELGGDLAPLDRFRVTARYAWTDPRFRAGSDDPGARGLCGITATSTTSTLCTIGPSRVGGNAGSVLVPYLDGNVPGRVPRHSWSVGVAVELPATPRGWRAALGADAGGQGDVYERGINGARYGAHTLVGARVSVTRRPWSIAVWGTNLLDDRYVRAASSRGAVFYPTSPRPLDVFYADRRRVGITVRYEPEPLR